MRKCSFELNNMPMSTFNMGMRSFDAFSGLDPYINKRTAICVLNTGPIPVGTYYIVDRESGGFLGWLYDMLGRREDWFALYANDGKLDDETYCSEVKRGNFRLHPKLGRGISKGCITIDRRLDFNTIRALLKASPKEPIPRSNIQAYGTVAVK